MRVKIALLFCMLLAACIGPPVVLPEPAIKTATTSEILLPTPAYTPSVTATPAPNPLTIAYLLERDYPASDLVIEDTLDPGSNYHRYIASYISDGLKQYGLLTVPFGEKPASGWPVIIFNHGYIPPYVYQTTERYIAYVDGFARSGYILFRPDYRGHANSQGQARGPYGYPDYVVDVLNAVAALKAYPEADPERLGMWGHSMGGYITLRAMVVDPDIKAGVIWAGVVASYEDMIDVGGRPRFGTRSLMLNYGPPDFDPDFWESISAHSYLADLSGPLQLHHGTADDSVPTEFSINLALEVREVGMVADLYIYEGDDHNISLYFTSAILRSIEFFDLHVKQEVEP